MLVVVVGCAPPPARHYAEIRVLDADTGRGVPLVELETPNGLRFVTDNLGRVAFHEPGLMKTPVFVSPRSPGYTVAKDGFGQAGFKLTPDPDKPAVIKLKRTTIAERLGRLTGEGRYRDSLLLGHETPPESNGRVVGQDSVQAAIHRDKVYYFWGDTQRIDYPLGLFRMAGATTPVPDPKTFDPAHGVKYDYFTGKDGFARAMMPLPERPDGVVWVESVFTVPDDSKVEKLVGRYSRRKDLTTEYEHGLALFDDAQEVFEVAKQLPAAEAWRLPLGHPIPFAKGGVNYVLFGSPSPNVRVPATLKDVLDASKYEAFTCADKAGGPMLNADGSPNWRWQKELPPTGSKAEADWIKAGKLKPEHARFHPADAGKPTDRVVLHSGTVRYNAHRKCWLLVAGQIGGGPSHLGEVWYAEAAHPCGPFPKAIKVATHPGQTLYNVCHHAFWDRDGGKVIHFEGTYTNDFSGNPEKTPRYNYNQLLYRLDLDAEGLKPAR